MRSVKTSMQKLKSIVLTEFWDLEISSESDDFGADRSRIAVLQHNFFDEFGDLFHLVVFHAKPGHFLHADADAARLARIDAVAGDYVFV